MNNPIFSLQQQVQSLSQQMAQCQSAVAAAAMNRGGGGSASGAPQTYPTSLITPFDYIVSVVLAANAQGTGIIQMSSDSAFELLRMLGQTSADVPANYFQNNFTALITDQSTGRQLASAPIPQCMLVTNSYQFGNDEKYPIMFPAQGIVKIDFTNLTAAQLTINFVLRGYKIYQTSPA